MPLDYVSVSFLATEDTPSCFNGGVCDLLGYRIEWGDGSVDITGTVTNIITPQTYGDHMYFGLPGTMFSGIVVLTDEATFATVSDNFYVGIERGAAPLPATFPLFAA